MNHQLSEPQIDAALDVLYRGLVAIRMAARAGDNAKCEALSDALHNLPHLLAEGHGLGWSIDQFIAMFLPADREPEFVEWAGRLKSLPRRGPSTGRP